jgi:feruloyl-CoA synthase
MSTAAMSPAARFAEPRVLVERRADGGMVLRSPLALGEPSRAVGIWLADWARRAPERIFLAERAGDGWRQMSYAAVFVAVRALGQALLERGLSPERPVMILSDNGVDHALLALGAMQVGVPVAPISTAYSRLSQDFAKLRAIAGLLRPGLVFADDGERYGAALRALDLSDAEVVLSANRGGLAATDFAALLGAQPTAAVDAAFARVGPDTIAKFLFTSGSTGEPKGVINTQRMLTSNQEALAKVWPLLALRPPVVVDWLPWNHTFGGNHNFNLVLRNGGTLWIDDGKPAPGLIERSVANLRAHSPTLYFNVPRGFALLLDFLERDAALARSFFAELDFVFYAGAALPQNLWQRLEQAALAATGRQLPFTAAWGTTETAPGATHVHFPVARAGNIGLPLPGTEIKLQPVGDRLEIRVRGPNVTPGYWRRPDLTAAAFDEEGFYCSGDAARLEEPSAPERGLVFDGRIGENFKLLSGTWVYVGQLRVAAIAAGAPVIEDAVVTGHDHDEVGLLVFPSLAGCRGLCPHLAPDAPLAALIGEPAVRERLAEALAHYNEAAGGSSHRIARALLMAEPPSIDKGEITDKGYINQRAVLNRRADLVSRLHAEPPSAEIIVPR